MSQEKDIATDFVVEDLLQYLTVICPVVLGVDRASFSGAVNQPDKYEIILKFSQSSDINTLFIGASVTHDVLLSSEIKLISSISKSCLAIVKTYEDQLVKSKPLADQLQVITLSTSSLASMGDSGMLYLNQFQRYVQQVYAPITRISSHLETVNDPNYQENMNNLQKRLRELELALEQCQRGTTIPRIELPIPPILSECAKKTNAAVVRGFLEKYNPSQVDNFFSELALDKMMGTSVEAKEEFANEVNKYAKSWPGEISRQTRLLETPFSGSIEREINFWRDIEKKMIDSKDQLDSVPLLLTKLVLKRTIRVSEQLINESETELDKSLEIVQISNSFLKEFPLEDLLAATDLVPTLNRAVTNSLQHFTKLRHSKYDFARAVKLLESLGQLVFTRMLSIFREKNILRCPIEEFRSLVKNAEEVFQTWEQHLITVRTILKDVAKRRTEKLKNLTFDLDGLQQRIRSLFEFREQHEKLLSIFGSVLSDPNDEAVTGTQEAFQYVIRNDSDLLDISSAGLSAWNSLKQMYEKRLEKTEDRITKLLEERLHGAKSADEMFKIFSTFNPLFFRPSIRNAVNSFRVVLVRNVRDDVKRLQEKFRFRYDESLEKTTADIHDIPPLSGRIIWARQIENQLATLMKRLEDVIGAGWEDHIEGKQLKEVCDELRSYLDTNALYNEWLSQQLRTDSQRYNKVKDFLLLVDDENKGVRVNFDDRQVTVFKEVRYLEWLLPSMSTAHKTIPRTIQSQSMEAYARYPTAMALQAAISGFVLAKKHINDSNEILLASLVVAVRDTIKEAFGGSKRSKRWIKWDTPDLNEWVGQLSSRVVALQERVDDVNEKLNKVNTSLSNLSTCPYQRSDLEHIIQDIQLIVDEMQMRGYSNINIWVSKLDRKVEDIIAKRIIDAIIEWTKGFSIDSNLSSSNENGDLETKDSESKGIYDVNLEVSVHEILLSNQVLYLSPPIENARNTWITYFHQYVSVALTLPRLMTSRFNVFAESSTAAKDYSSLLKTLDKIVVSSAYKTVESKVAGAKKYVQHWLQYQALWDASPSNISDKVGRDISKWLQLLTEIKASRETIDSSIYEKSFGPIVISQQQVQNKINVKYDTWQKECQTRFSVILSEEIKLVHADLASAKAKLEGIYLEGPTREVIIGVEFILKMKASLPSKKKLVQDLELSEKTLQKQRFSFPRDWFAATNVTSAFNDFSQILLRRYQTMEGQMISLQAKIKEEDQIISSRIEELMSSWEQQKPDSGGLNIVEVMNTLNLFSSHLQKLSEDLTRLKAAKDALEMEVIDDDKLSFINQELTLLREVWTTLIPIDDKLSSLRAILLKDIAPTKIRKGLDEINDLLRALPPKFKSYAAVEWFQDKIGKLLSAQSILRDICSDALKDRHWKQLFAVTGIPKGSGNHLDLSLGALWDANLMHYKKPITDILSTAQGELALEQFLRDLRDNWLGYELSLVARDSIRLIAGWDVLFTTLEDNLNSLASIKQSPYFRNVPEFQEDTANWETRLTNLRGIFEVWVEVQRKWVYLRGIFRNADIKAQLPTQYTKFKSVDNEFSNLTKRVASKPSAMELLQIDNLHRQLERQESTMSLIQKALGDYLERQRQYFPRFYFVNNDDLVEIIGNANEPAKIIPHLGKMFAAITTIDISDISEAGQDSKNVLATAMISKEGEKVLLESSVNMLNNVKDWLGDLQNEMKKTLAHLLQRSLNEFPMDNGDLMNWTNSFPAQIVILASQISWCQDCENSFGNQSEKDDISSVVTRVDSRLRSMSENILSDMSPDLRQKCEQLLTEMVHQRDVTRVLQGTDKSQKISNRNEFGWLYHLRFYWSPKEADLMQRLSIKMSNASFFYGFEYLGIGERLVQTPLTDRCYLTLTQALHFRMGGNPFGPAGTGKTESVKMLGSQLGRFVLVFNCDASFDYAAMGRIFSGLCQVGAWGCFDEFNRLEERILSAVSQQILTIQQGLMMHQEQIELLGHPCKLHKDVGIFVTLNPGYAGRSNLPDNLKQLFRAVAMTIPDRRLIAQVMLFAQGIVSAEDLAGKIVLLFILCEEQLSSQSHYDFGLRALKSVLTGAGDLKRLALRSITSDKSSKENMPEIEKDVLIKSTCDSIVPKLVAEDIPLFRSLLQAVFPDSKIPDISEQILLETIKSVCDEDTLECSDAWVEKVLQLKQVLDMRHGVMMVGPSGSGKTSAWKTLFKSLSRLEGSKGDFYIIDPKSIRKETLYGVLDPNTLEWTDGIFTKVLRKVSDISDARHTARRSWIIFDGDVDPEWAENLNSVLDDNKVLTLPNGDRLRIPNHVKIMMEVDSLQHATLATVSRCGMVWFAEGTISLDMMLRQHLRKFRKENIIQTELSIENVVDSKSAVLMKTTQDLFVDAISPLYTAQSGIVGIGLEFSVNQPHIMEATVGRLLSTLYSVMLRGLSLAVEYNENNSDFPMSQSHMQSFATKWLLFAVLWAFAGSMSNDKRYAFGDMLMENCMVDPPPNNKKLLDFFVNVSDGSWIEWATLVGPRMEIESHKVVSSDVVITTVDTVRHTEVLRAWLASHQPLILCGPPGSGKTMTLTALLEAMPEYVLVSLNFSSGSTPDLILKTFAQYCEVVDSPDGLILQPNRQSYRESQWVVIFCDEINLPERDAYGTQRVIMFLRQLTEQRGYWNSDCKWVSLKRIQFVGACNPPTDAGRVPLPLRFMRHSPLLLVDYPTELSLKQIYRTFIQALLKLHPNLKGYVDPMTNAMVEFYILNQTKFTADAAPQYIYSPRELSRWVRSLYEAMEPVEAMTNDELVRLWGHEALRLFHDRLITDDERKWCDNQVDVIARKHFAGVDLSKALQRPMLFSSWIKKHYQSTEREILRNFVAQRLKVFYEEELDVPLVIFDDVLEHVLRIDNVLRHPMGHVLLAGESGVGKTVLSRFVSWINGLKVFQIKADSRYTVEQFDDDLRSLLRRVGVDGEKICFIFDEGNALSTAFLERMNALLASGEVPGLFEGDDRSQLLLACRESFSQRGETMIDSEDEIWRSFTRLVQRNLHVVFTMNPASADFANRCTTSPALFNRCVVDWFGTWSQSALIQVAHEFTNHLDTGYTKYQGPTNFKNSSVGETFSSSIEILQSVDPGLHEAVVSSLVTMHITVKKLSTRLSRTSSRPLYLSPRDFLDLINKFISTEQEKRSYLEDQQTHIRTGLQKLIETQDRVAALRREMVEKDTILRAKDIEANTKLTSMVEKQNEAEYRKGIAEKLTQELTKQNEEIRVRLETVERELSEAEPALNAAKESVQNIRRNQLDEVRVLSRPPNLVQLTLEMVCVMMGEKNLDWAEIRKVLRRDDFIATVVNFDPSSLTSKTMKTVQDNYLSNPELDYQSVDRASKACGPLYLWGESQIRYATILRKIKPFRDEVAMLQEKSRELEIQQQEAVQNVQELENAIKRYKAEYAAAIRDTEIIRSEMDIVKMRVSRAESLLLSLEQENTRWNQASNTFEMQMSTLIGDCLIAAAFQTYAGNFDHKERKNLMIDWYDILDSLGVPYRPELDIIAYLSKLSDQMKWRSFGLSSDDLALQNAILLDRFNRYPLVIDPPGQAASFIMAKYESQKIIRTSMLDTSFFKTLANAIRFGTPLLVQDVETVDPILNPILNKEIQRTGGRTLIRLGNEEIDFNPKFLIILITRNGSARFAPDLCSRVTIVNFTVTPASLQSQALSAILRSERPDVERKRNEILRLQTEQSAKLRELEEALLNKISAVQGAILDDDSVINSLESLKREAADLNTEALKTSEVFDELVQISRVYEPLAEAMTTVYFTLESLADVNFMYQFSLQFFLSVVNDVLSSMTSAAMSDSNEYMKRLNTLSNSFFSEISRRVLRSLKYEDKLLFVARLAQIASQSQQRQGNEDLTTSESDLLFRGVTPISMMDHAAQSSMLSKCKNIFNGIPLEDSAAKRLMSVSLLPSFSQLLKSMENMDGSSDQWISFMNSNEPENCVPLSWLSVNEASSVFQRRISLLKLMIIQALRPEKILPAIENFVHVVFGDTLQWREQIKIDLKGLIERDSKSSIPIMLCADPGQDSSSKVDKLATMMNKSLLQVAMGSAEGFVEADKLIAQGVRTGAWVLLKNIHLCVDWLSTLEKRLPSLLATAHDNFRLFLTCEIHPKIPTTLLKMSEVLIYEASSGIKANLQKFYSSIPSSRIDKQPTERSRLYGLIAWFHAVVQERLRYTPLGWTKKYEFTEIDAAFALDIIDQWIDESAGQRAHIDPADLPWDAIKTLLSQSVYGGRIDNPFDQIALDSFIESIFSPMKYVSGATLVSDGSGSPILSLPDGINRQSHETWIKELPDTNSPAWIGLPTTAETQLRILSGQQTLSKLSALQGLSEDIRNDTDESTSSSGQGKLKAAIIEKLNRWTHELTQSTTQKLFSLDLSSLDVNASAIERCILREIVKGKHVYSLVREDLDHLSAFLKGETKGTNRSRDILSCVSKGQVPKHWFDEYAVFKGVNLTTWINDLNDRIKYLDNYHSIVSNISAAASQGSLKAILNRGSYWLGGFFSPEALITATRQAAAEINGWSLEDLELWLDIGSQEAVSNGFTAEGLTLEGAKWIEGIISLTDDLRCKLPKSSLVWKIRSASHASGIQSHALTMPMYLNEGRGHVVSVLYVQVPSNVSSVTWAQRGVCILLQSTVQ